MIKLLTTSASTLFSPFFSFYIFQGIIVLILPVFFHILFPFLLIIFRHILSVIFPVLFYLFCLDIFWYWYLPYSLFFNFFFLRQCFVSINCHFFVTFLCFFHSTFVGRSLPQVYYLILVWNMYIYIYIYIYIFTTMIVHFLKLHHCFSFYLEHWF